MLKVPLESLKKLKSCVEILHAKLGSILRIFHRHIPPLRISTITNVTRTPTFIVVISVGTTLTPTLRVSNLLETAPWSSENPDLKSLPARLKTFHPSPSQGTGGSMMPSQPSIALIAFATSGELTGNQVQYRLCDPTATRCTQIWTDIYCSRS